ncbi:hypothetical protein ACKWTF_001478 [Chironomus riparius]
MKNGAKIGSVLLEIECSYVLCNYGKLLNEAFTSMTSSLIQLCFTTDGKRERIIGFTSYIIISNFVTKIETQIRKYMKNSCLMSLKRALSSYSDYNGNPYN